MNRDTRLLRWLPRFVVGSCGALAFTAVPAYAQRREPAATLMPARPALAPVVVRGATPDATLPSFTGTYVPAVAAAPNPKASWVGNKLTNLKDTVIGKPNPNPEARSPDPDPRLIGAPTNPLMGSGSQAQSQQPPQSVYATPPAYRWYGWGGTTPGANPHAPTGVYPQGSANWYSQTGATPGAFPVTMTKSTAESPSIEPPVYAGRINSEPGGSAQAAGQEHRRARHSLRNRSRSRVTFPGRRHRNRASSHGRRSGHPSRVTSTPSRQVCRAERRSPSPRRRPRVARFLQSRWRHPHPI